MLKESDIKIELGKFNFLIEAKVSESSCEVSYPERLFPKKIEAFQEKYIIEPGAGVKLICSMKDPIFVEMPDYCIRFFIITNIVINCVDLLKTDVLSIMCTDSTGKDLGRITDINFPVLENNTEEDKIKEQNMWDIWVTAYISGFSDSMLDTVERLQIKEGYHILQQVFQGEFQCQ